MKIAVIQQSPDLGGAETFMLSLIKEFKKNRHKVFLITNKGRYFDEAVNNSINPIPVPFFLDIMGNFRGLVKTILLLPSALSFYTKTLKRLKREECDLILMSGFSEKIFVSFISTFYKIPVFWIEYGPLNPVFKRNFYIPKLAYYLTKNIPIKIIVPSENTKKSLLKDANVKDTKLRTISCGIDIKLTKVKKKQNKDLVIGNVSRLAVEKGQADLILGFSKLLEKIPQSKLILVGDGPAKNFYIKLVKKLNIEKKVTFTGYVEDPLDYIRDMDVFVFPSKWDLEGFGLVAVEAMINKIPVIATDNGPIPEIVLNGKTGIIVEKGNIEKLTESLVKLGTDSKLREKLGQNGLIHASKTYDIENISKTYLATFNE